MKKFKLIFLILFISLFTIVGINNVKVFAADESICEHTDGEELEDDRCDKCNQFIGSDLVLGQNNIVQTNLFNYRRFIPEETHNY